MYIQLEFIIWKTASLLHLLVDKGTVASSDCTVQLSVELVIHYGKNNDTNKSTLSFQYTDIQQIQFFLPFVAVVIVLYWHSYIWAIRTPVIHPQLQYVFLFTWSLVCQGRHVWPTLFLSACTVMSNSFIIHSLYLPAKKTTPWIYLFVLTCHALHLFTCLTSVSSCLWFSVCISLVFRSLSLILLTDHWLCYTFVFLNRPLSYVQSFLKMPTFFFKSTTIIV